jgi:hypothetical protein
VLFDLANELVSFFLRHLPTAYHILYQVSGAFDDESAESGCGVYDILHRSGHFASGFEADLMGFRRHFGDSVLDIGSAVAGASLWRDRRCAVGGGSRGSRLGRFFVLSHHTLLIYYGLHLRDFRGGFRASARFRQQRRR